MLPPLFYPYSWVNVALSLLVGLSVKVKVKSLLYNLNKRAVRHQFNLRLPNSNISILVLGTLIIRLTSSNGILRFNRSCNNNSPICGLRSDAAFLRRANILIFLLKSLIILYLS